MAYTIQIDLNATDNASPQFTEVQGSLLDLDQAQTQTAGSTKQLAEETGKTSSAFSQFKNEISGLVTGLGAIEVIKKVGEFYQLGESARVANGTFVQLSGGTQQATDNLAMMQAATGGVINNMTLMNGANRLILS